MRILAIAGIALKRFIRDRANLFFVFILPIGIIILIGAQFGGGFLPRVALNSPQDGGAVADSIRASLAATAEVELVTLEDRQAVVDAVALGKAAVGVIMPDRLSARLAAGETPTVELIGPAGATTAPYEVLVRRAVASAFETEAAIRFAISRGAMRAAATAGLAAIAGDVPVIWVEAASAGESLFAGVGSQFEIGATSQLVLFMFLTGLAGSAALIQGRRFGVTRRILGTPTAAYELVIGEAVGRFAVVMIQGLYVVLATALMFQTDWGNLLGAAAVIIAFAACGAGAAILFGTLFRNDQQAIGVAVVAGLGIAALGGCMLPLELFPPAMERVAYFTPHAWALDAFADLQRRDATLVDILPQLGVISAFAVALLALAAWRMSATLGKV